MKKAISGVFAVLLFLSLNTFAFANTDVTHTQANIPFEAEQTTTIPEDIHSEEFETSEIETAQAPDENSYYSVDNATVDNSEANTEVDREVNDFVSKYQTVNPELRLTVLKIMATITILRTIIKRSIIPVFVFVTIHIIKRKEKELYGGEKI